MAYILAGNWKMGTKRWMVAEPLPLLLTIAPSSVGSLLLAFACGGDGGILRNRRQREKEQIASQVLGGLKMDISPHIDVLLPVHGINLYPREIWSTRSCQPLPEFV